MAYVIVDILHIITKISYYKAQINIKIYQKLEANINRHNFNSFITKNNVSKNHYKRKIYWNRWLYVQLCLLCLLIDFGYYKTYNQGTS